MDTPLGSYQTLLMITRWQEAFSGYIAPYEDANKRKSISRILFLYWRICTRLLGSNLDGSVVQLHLERSVCWNVTPNHIVSNTLLTDLLPKEMPCPAICTIDSFVQRCDIFVEIIQRDHLAIKKRKKKNHHSFAG